MSAIIIHNVSIHGKFVWNYISNMKHINKKSLFSNIKVLIKLDFKQKSKIYKKKLFFNKGHLWSLTLFNENVRLRNVALTENFVKICQVINDRVWKNLFLFILFSILKLYESISLLY